MKNIGI